MEHRETQDVSAASAGLFPPRHAITIAMPHQLGIGMVMQPITDHLHVVRHRHRPIASQTTEANLPGAAAFGR